MRVVQVAVKVWLVLDDAYRPRFLIVYGPAVHRPTGETHMLYRIDRHHLQREHRHPEAWVETYVEAEAWCREKLGTPSMTAPVRDGYGGAVTAEEQRRRWEAGLDPVTGKPRR